MNQNTTYDAALTMIGGDTPILFLDEDRVCNAQGQVLANFRGDTLINLHDQSIAVVKGEDIYNWQNQRLASVSNGKLLNLQNQVIGYATGEKPKNQVRVAAYYFFL